MSISPEGNLTLQISEVPEPSKTYKVDWDSGRILGFVDNQEAVKQAILKMLITERYKYLIYDNQYGSELSYIISQDLPENLIAIMVKSDITETLMLDSRITSIDNFQIEFSTQSNILVSFDVDTIFGSASFQKLQVRGDI